MLRHDTFAQSIAALSLSDRETVATNLQVPVDQLDEVIVDPAFWLHWYRKLPRPTRALLDRMRRAGGVLPQVIAQRIGGVLRTNLDTVSPRTYLTIHHPLSPFEQLFVAGIIWPTDKGWSVPVAVQDMLPQAEPLFGSCGTTIHAQDIPLDLDELLYRVACMGLDGRLPVQQHGRVSAVVAQRLAMPVTQVQWLVACCVAGGALRNEHNRYVPTAVMLDWLELPHTERCQEFARAWLQAAWSEWELVPKRRAPVLDVRQARRAVLQVLLSHIPDEWCDVDAMLDMVRMGWPDVLRPSHGDVRWSAPAGWPVSWSEDDGVLLRLMWCGPCAWLGLVECADEGHAIRRTPLGAWLAGLSPQPHLVGPAPVVLEHDYSVIVPDSRNIWARFQLHRIGVAIDEHTVQLAPQYAKKAIANGMTIGEYVDIVAAIIDRPLQPDTHRAMLAWASDVVHVSLTQNILLTCGDARVASDIALDRRFAALEFVRLNDTTLMIERTRASECVKTLREAGYVVEAEGLRGSGFSTTELALIDKGLAQLADTREVVALRERIQQLRRRGGV